MINYLKWYKRDIKINCKGKFYTKECYFLRTEPVTLDCGSLLKETVPCFEEPQDQKEHIECEENAGMLHGQENGQTNETEITPLKHRSHYKSLLS